MNPKPQAQQPVSISGVPTQSLVLPVAPPSANAASDNTHTLNVSGRLSVPTSFLY